MAYIVKLWPTGFLVMAYIVMAYTVMAYTVMAYIVMASRVAKQAAREVPTEPSTTWACPMEFM